MYVCHYRDIDKEAAARLAGPAARAALYIYIYKSVYLYNGSRVVHVYIYIYKSVYVYNGSRVVHLYMYKYKSVYVCNGSRVVHTYIYIYQSVYVHNGSRVTPPPPVLHIGVAPILITDV